MPGMSYAVFELILVCSLFCFGFYILQLSIIIISLVILLLLNIQYYVRMYNMHLS